MGIFHSKIIKEFGNLEPKNEALFIKGYIDERYEVSDFSISFATDYQKVVQESLNIWKQYTPKLYDCQRFSFRDLVNAKQELLDSYTLSLRGKNYLYTCDGIYDQVKDMHCRVIPGVKLHLREETLHLEGLLLLKVIKRHGSVTNHDHSPKALAKSFLKGKTRLAMWRQYKLTSGKFAEIDICNVKSIKPGDC